MSKEDKVMIYIRTKDGVYEIERYYEPRDYYWVKQDYDNQPIGSEEVLKQADTIEELCDEFVGIDSQGHYIIHNDQWLDGARIVPLEDIEYYGAIWTDRGLIYVAKMNKKGELELI